MGSVYQQKGRTHWMVKYWRDGRPIIESTGTTDEKKARGILKAREVDIDRGVPLTAKVGRMRFDEAAADLINDYKVNDRRSLNVLERRVKKHLQPYFGNRRMSTITQADIRAYITHRREQPIVTGTGETQTSRQVSNGEINRELTALKRAFTLAVQGGKLLHAPHIPMLKESNVRTGFFELAQFAAVRGRLPRDLQPVVTFAYITGWRIPSEVLPLEWRQVDFASGEVRLDPGQTKNGEGRVFPMTDDLRALLLALHAERTRRQRAGQMAPWVFVRMVAKGRGGSKSPKPILSITKAWNAACIGAGLPGRIPHDLRRTAVRNMVRAGVPERVAMQLTGHKTRSVFERYNIVSEGDLTSAAVRLSGQFARRQAPAQGEP